MAEKVYVCTAEHCTLGTLGSPGRFAGGITKEAVNLLTGRPLEELKKGVDYGEGICTNCGTPGAEHDAEAEAAASIDEQIKALQAQKKELV